MIELMGNLPDNVVGFTAVGHVTGTDYETVVVPAVEKALKEHSKIRLIYHLGDGFESFTAVAMWDDAKVGLRHLTSWERVAVVTDVDWIGTTTKVLGFVMPGHVRVFGNDELDRARAWVSE